MYAKVETAYDEESHRWIAAMSMSVGGNHYAATDRGKTEVEALKALAMSLANSLADTYRH
jgi:hypothetical protein